MTKRTSGADNSNRRRVSGEASGPPPHTPVVHDPSSTTALLFTGTGGNWQPAAPFTPPGGAVIIVMVECTFTPASGVADNTLAVTDSLASHLIWTAGPSYTIGHAGASFGSAIWTFWAYVGASSPGAMTVTVTNIGGAAVTLSYVDGGLDVWTGAKISNPIGAISTGGSSGSAWSATVTPHQVGSAIVGCVNNGNLSAAPVPGSGDFIYQTASFASWQASIWRGTSGGPTTTTSLSPVTLAAAMGSGAVPSWVVYEVLAA